MFVDDTVKTYMEYHMGTLTVIRYLLLYHYIIW